MTRGTVRIVLREPVQEGHDALGQPRTDFRELVRYATREEYRGRIDVAGDVEFARWDRAYTVRDDCPAPRWELYDPQDNLRFTVESVVRPSRRRIELRCVARA